MKNMNWGKWIALIFSVYVAFLLFWLVYSFSLDINLVEEDYYAKDIAYQEQIERIKRTVKLDEQVDLVYFPKERVYRIRFPKIGPIENYSGDVLLFRPANSKLDFSLPVKIDSSYTMRINTGKMQKGFWRIKIAWQVGNEKYYNEDSIER